MRPSRTPEGGQTLVLTALLMTVMLGIAGLAIDVGMWYVERERAQTAADFAALAGAAQLPANPAVARSAAIASAASNVDGETTAVATGFGGDQGAVEVVVDVSAATYFTKIFGLDSVDISRRAVARRAVSPFPTALYAHNATCGTGNGIVVNGNNLDIDAGIVSNGGFRVNGNNNTAAAASAGGPNNCAASVNGNNNGFPTAAAPVVDRTAHDWPVYHTRSDFACTYTYASYTVNANNVTLAPGTYCVTGRFTLNGNHTQGNITVIADSFTINGNNYNFTPYSRNVLFLQTGSSLLTWNGNAYDWRGYVLAPNATVRANGNSFDAYTGMIAAMNIEINGNSFAMNGTGPAITGTALELVE